MASPGNILQQMLIFCGFPKNNSHNCRYIFLMSFISLCLISTIVCIENVKFGIKLCRLCINAPA